MRTDKAKERADLLGLLDKLESCARDQRIMASILASYPHGGMVELMPGCSVELMPGFSVMQDCISQELESLLAAMEMRLTAATLQ